MEDFFDAEISIYSRAEFFIYLFEDFIQRFSNETPCPYIFLKDVRRFSTKHIKYRYLHEISEKSRTGINGYFCIKNPLLWKCPIYASTHLFYGYSNTWKYSHQLSIHLAFYIYLQYLCTYLSLFIYLYVYIYLYIIICL